MEKPKRSQRKQRFLGQPELSVGLHTVRGEALAAIRARDARRMELADSGKLAGQSIYRPAPTSKPLVYAELCAGRTTLAPAA